MSWNSCREEYMYFDVKYILYVGMVKVMGIPQEKY